MSPSEQIRPITIGVAGGSGSGKTTVVRTILERIGAENIAYIPHDSYYRELATLPQHQHALINFDHPDSLDSELFIEHIRTLQNYQPVHMPIYDFATDSRTADAAG